MGAQGTRGTVYCVAPPGAGRRGGAGAAVERVPLWPSNAVPPNVIAQEVDHNQQLEPRLGRTQRGRTAGGRADARAQRRAQQGKTAVDAVRERARRR